VPLTATHPKGGQFAVVGTYPALLAASATEKSHFLRSKYSKPAVLLPDYLVEQDLPSAYQEFLRQQTPTPRGIPAE
jgi:hypothetical protein